MSIIIMTHVLYLGYFIAAHFVLQWLILTKQVQDVVCKPTGKLPIPADYTATKTQLSKSTNLSGSLKMKCFNKRISDVRGVCV